MKKIKNKKSHELRSKCVLNKNTNSNLTHKQNYLSLLESSLNSILKFLLGSRSNGYHAIFKSKSSPPDIDQNTTIQALFALQQCKQTKPIFESKHTGQRNPTPTRTPGRSNRSDPRLPRSERKTHFGFEC